MRFKEFSEAIDIEKDPSVQIYRLLTQPIDAASNIAKDVIGSSDSSSNAPVPSSGGGKSVSGNEPAFKEPGFKEALDKVASNLGVDSKNLLQIMKRESNIDPRSVNKQGGASGLIQFTGDTAGKLGTSLDAIRRMTAVEQLELVEKYYKRAGVKPGASVEDLYMLTFYPAAAGRPDNAAVLKKGTKAYAYNSGMDQNKDGVITVADVKNFLHGRA